MCNAIQTKQHEEVVPTFTGSSIDDTNIPVISPIFESLEIHIPGPLNAYFLNFMSIWIHHLINKVHVDIFRDKHELFLTTLNKKGRTNNTVYAQAKDIILIDCGFGFPEGAKKVRLERRLVLVNLHFIKVLIRISNKFTRKHTSLQQEK